jgi:hypothetical protein
VQIAFRLEFVNVKVEKVANPEEFAFTTCELVPQPLTVAVTWTVDPPGAKLVPEGSMS